jgi:hypothetical protein
MTGDAKFLLVDCGSQERLFALPMDTHERPEVLRRRICTYLDLSGNASVTIEVRLSLRFLQ